MCDADRTEIGLRNEPYDTFIEIYSTHVTSGVEGPYYIEVHEQVAAMHRLRPGAATGRLG